MPDEPTTQEKREKLDEILRDVQISMFTTTDPDTGRLHSRPMHLQGGIDDGSLYFFTYESSDKVDDFTEEREVNCSFADTSGSKYASVAGRARLVKDRAKMEDKWAEPLRAWFADGIDTPGIVLIQVNVNEGQYWDSRNQTMLHAYGVLKAAITGEPVKDAGDNEKVSL
jgi:general stress protein 26